jgi:hypothetical protein
MVCHAQGHDRSADARTIRTGCSAMIHLLKNEDESWYVSRFDNYHNHPMSCTLGERKQWNSHNRIDRTTRDLIKNLRENNVQISRVCSIVGAVNGAGGYVPFRRQSIRSLCGRLAQESIEGDMEKTVKMFDDIKKTDPGLLSR